LGEKGFCNQVHSELGLVAIVEIENVRVCVKEWVGIGKPNRVAIPVTFARRDASFDHGTHLERSGEIIQWAARVWGSINAILHK
jgi:hypothetical protein